MYRADHYEAADRLINTVRRQLAQSDLTPFEVAVLDLLAGIGHATLAAAGPGVEAEVKANERAVSAAVVSAEETRVRLLGGTVAAVVESPAYGTEQTDSERARDRAELDALADSIRPATTCRCTGMPHDLGSPGCEQPEARLFPIDPRQEGKTARSREAARTVRPKPGPPKGGRQ